MKKQSGLFDVTTGACDGAEVCELVGMYMLSLISEKYNKKDFGLYRDDGLGLVKNKSGLETEKIMKKIQKVFQENKLDIVILCNMKIVNYLGISLSSNNSYYKPYRKSYKKILYILKYSNHPPSTLKQIPTSIEKRISTLHSNQTIFNESEETYQNTLEKSGYRQTSKYQPANENVSNNKRNRKRNVIWFNPPFSVNAKTKVGNYSLNLIRKHFPPRYKFSKLFNRTTIKIATAACHILKSKYTKTTKTS